MPTCVKVDAHRSYLEDKPTGAVKDAVMARYSSELQEQIVRKMILPTIQSIAKNSRETIISSSTQNAWCNQYRTQGYVVTATHKDPEGCDWKAKALRLCHLIVRVAPSHFRHSEIEPLLDDPTKVKVMLDLLPEITVQEMCSMMVREDLESAKIQVLLKRHGHKVYVTKELG